jgi:hypothetical protein
MARLDEFELDTSAVEDGKWFDIRPATSTAKAMRWRLRSVASKKFRTTENKLVKEFRKDFIANGGNHLAPDRQDDYDALLLTDGAVVDWEGVEEKDGTEIRFSRKNALRVVTEYPRLRRELFMWARSDENFKPAAQREAEQEEILGN